MTRAEARQLESETPLSERASGHVSNAQTCVCHTTKRQVPEWWNGGAVVVCKEGHGHRDVEVEVEEEDAGRVLVAQSERQLEREVVALLRDEHQKRTVLLRIGAPHANAHRRQELLLLHRADAQHSYYKLHVLVIVPIIQANTHLTTVLYFID